MPELPEVETTRRGLTPLIVGKRIESFEIREPRLRWPVPNDLDARLGNRRIERLGRRAKYLLIVTDGGTLIVHLGMSGSLRYLPKPLGCRGARSHRHPPCGRRAGAIQRSAPLRQPALRRGAARSSAAQTSRARTAWRRVRRRVSRARVRRTARGDQAAPHEQPRRCRSRQHLRERSAVSSRDPPRATGRTDRPATIGHARGFGSRRARSTRSAKAVRRCVTSLRATGGPVISSCRLRSTIAPGLRAHAAACRSACAGSASAQAITVRRASGRRAWREIAEASRTCRIRPSTPSESSPVSQVLPRSGLRRVQRRRQLYRSPS